jgi:hypothetical protein
MAIPPELRAMRKAMGTIDALHLTKKKYADSIIRGEFHKSQKGVPGKRDPVCDRRSNSGNQHVLALRMAHT